MDIQYYSILSEIETKIFDSFDFEKTALLLLSLHSQKNPIYKKYLNLLQIKPEKIHKVTEIPFLPVEFFKEYEVILENIPTIENFFTSSGTSHTQKKSKHLLPKLSLYYKATEIAFYNFFKKLPYECGHIAILPNYEKNPHSSLIHMIKYFMENSRAKFNDFLKPDPHQILTYFKKIELNDPNTPYLLWGTTYILVNLAKENLLPAPPNVNIIETGGFKLSGIELTRMEIHEIISKAFRKNVIYSEYGMTELLSQAYANSELFIASPLLRVFVKDIYDPLSNVPHGKEGRLCFIDLANIYSCPFIMTDDIGVTSNNITFKVFGRLFESDLRGCNLLSL